MSVFVKETDATVMTATPSIDDAVNALRSFEGANIDAFELKKPPDLAEAKILAELVLKNISKFSPLIGNFVEYQAAEHFNTVHDLPKGAEWVRQDPEFPDITLAGVEDPAPGIEIKAWYPFATEITGRFKESQANLADDNVKVAVICWLPEYILFGEPQILSIWLDDALAMARSRDQHYHDPPGYLVLEPENTEARTRNLQQRNCNGHKFQDAANELAKAQEEVGSWDSEKLHYSPEREYQDFLRERLIQRFNYRLDTNFAKIDRIDHESLENFKSGMLEEELFGRTIAEWRAALQQKDESALAELLEVDG